MIQWDSLESYFSSNFNFDDDPTENNSDGKTSREKRLENTFSQPFSKLYAMLVQFGIPIFDILNTFCKLWNHWFVYCIILLCICITHYFQDLPYFKLSQNQMIC